MLEGTADRFAVLAGSTITNTGDSVINGDLGLHPGTAVTGFPPGTATGAQHVTDAVAERAKADLTIAYKDAAGRPLSATAPPDLGGRTLGAGVYRTGSVPSLGLTGTLTLDAEGDPAAVFIFQVESTLVTATDSAVSLVGGAQACNVYWQVGSSATLGTRTAFKGTVLALTSISVNEGVTVDGSLLARNGAVTLINDTITRSVCAAGTHPVGSEPGVGEGPEPGAGPETGAGPGAGATPGSGANPGGEPGPPAARGPRGSAGPGPGPDLTGPAVRLFDVPGVRPAPLRGRGGGRPPARAVCATRDFTARVNLRDRAGIRLVNVYLDGRLIRQTARARLSLRVDVRSLRVGRHRIRVVARDRAGNVSVTTRRFARCALAPAAPRFTG